INASLEGVKINGDKVSITAGSEINLAIEGAKEYAESQASNAEQSAKDYALAELDKASEDLVQKNKIITEINLDKSGAQIKGDRIELTAGSAIKLAIDSAVEHADAAQKAVTDVANSKVAPSEVIPSINLDKTGAQIDGKKIALSAGSAIKLAIDAAENNAKGHTQESINNLQIGGTNLIPKTDFEEYINPPNGWSTWGKGATLNNRIQFSEYILVQNNNLTTTLGFTSDRLN